MQVQIPFDATTYRAVVSKSKTVEELIENLYEFVLQRPFDFKGNSSKERLTSATVQFIVDFLSAIDEAQKTRLVTDRFEFAVSILAIMRQPKKSARVHTEAGLRQRIGQILLQDKYLKEPLHFLPDLSDFPAPENHEAFSRLPINVDAALRDLQQFLDGIVERKWDEIKAAVIDNVRTQVHVVKRRKAIIEVLERSARTHFRRISSLAIEQAMKKSPKEIIAAVAKRSDIKLHGHKRLTPEKLRHDVRVVRQNLTTGVQSLQEFERTTRAEIAEVIENLKKTEGGININYSMNWLAKKVHELVEAVQSKADEK